MCLAELGTNLAMLEVFNRNRFPRNYAGISEWELDFQAIADGKIFDRIGFKRETI